MHIEKSVEIMLTFSSNLNHKTEIIENGKVPHLGYLYSEYDPNLSHI